MTTPTVELVPGDDFSLTVTLTDADGDVIDYSGWSVHTAQITWSDDTTTDLTVDLSNADTGVFVLTCADTDTDGKRLGLLHELRFKLESSGGLEKTVYYADVKGVETLTTDTATGYVPGLSAAQIKSSYESNADTNAFTDAEQTKLSGIETGATADQTGAEIKALYEAEADTNAFTDAEKSKLSGIASGAEVNTVDSVNGLTGTVVLDPDDLNDAATTNKFTTAADIAKLSGIETGADVTDATNVAAAGAAMVSTYDPGGVSADAFAMDNMVEGTNTKIMTDAERSKLAGIEAGATADQTGAEIKAAYEGEADTNAYTDAEKSKLAGIEASADVTDAASVAAAGAVMDGDFATNGLMKRAGAGTYDTVTDNSSNWNTAFGWGDHASEGYLTSVAVGDLTDWPASVSTTEIGYLDGVTSAIQTQLNAKAATSAVREKLTANRTYYVRTDGSDSNDGLSNTSGGAFLTIQKAYDTICTLDLGGFDATISVADGTYTDRLVIDKQFFGGNVTLTGSTSAIISPSSGACVDVTTSINGAFTVNGMKFVSTGSNGRGISMSAGGQIYFKLTDFGECSRTHILCDDSGGRVESIGNYSITGNTPYHWQAHNAGTIAVFGKTITLTGTIAFTRFAIASSLGLIVCNGDTFSGSATGTRYLASENGVIQTLGGGATYLPGSVAGSTSTGGQYA